MIYFRFGGGALDSAALAFGHEHAAIPSQGDFFAVGAVVVFGNLELAEPLVARPLPW